MKTKLITSFLALAFAINLSAADKHGHDHEHSKAGPTGGKIIANVEPHAEFFVNADKKIEIRFVDEDNKVIAPAEQLVTVTMGERSSPTKLTFTKDGDKLISDKTIPTGNDLPTVVQIKATSSAKAITEKFNLNLNKCPTCSNLEYACTCEHGDEHDHDHKEGDGHDHKNEKKK